MRYRDGSDHAKVTSNGPVASWTDSVSRVGLQGGGDETFFFASAALSTPRYEGAIDTMSAFGRDSDGKEFYIGVDGDTFGLGVNVLGHDCLAVGIISLMEIVND